MAFSNPIIDGNNALVVPAIQSPDYIPGISGWIIRRDGTAEFNNVIVRGTIHLQSGNATLDSAIVVDGYGHNVPTIQFNPDNVNYPTPAYILSSVGPGTGPTHPNTPELDFFSPSSATQRTSQLRLVSRETATRPPRIEPGFDSVINRLADNAGVSGPNWEIWPTFNEVQGSYTVGDPLSTVATDSDTHQQSMSMKCGHTVVATSAAAVGIVGFTTPFPHGIITVLASAVAIAGSVRYISIWDTGGVGSIGFNFVCYDSAGAPMTSRNITINWIAVGW